MKLFSVTAPANSSPELPGKSTMTRSAYRLQQPGSPAALKLTVLTMLMLLASTGHAATADISQMPLAITKSAKPNIMFILDDSGSMSWDFMPDDVQPNMGSNVQPSGVAYPTPNYSYPRYLRENTYGAWSAQCNGLAFNPDPKVLYLPPIKADGSSYPNAILHFPASPSTTDPIINIVPTDGFASVADAANRTATQDCSAFDSSHPPAYCKLSGAFYYQYNPNILDSQPALSWIYNTDGTVVKTSKFFTQCQSNIGSVPGNAFFTKKLIDSNTPANELQKYANWYAYYRTRQLTMRTAAGLAFQTPNADSRIGFTVINDPTITSTGANAKFLETLDFTSTQKSAFYQLLYTLPTTNGTPLRGSLSKIGKYFANKLPGQTAANGPIQYSCQRNFAILSTDGYWNAGLSDNYPNPGLETSSYGPLRLDNTAIDNTDGTEATPMKDSLGSSNSLADVAEYYWATDLRPDLTDDVPPVTDANPPDPNRKQHLNTYTVGLGVRGTLRYHPGYLDPLNALSDYPNLSNGTMSWPIPAGSGKENATHIDDLWHAAVNGRGQYFSVSNPESLASALKTVLESTISRSGTGSAAATSTQTPIQTDKSVFIASYTSVSWTGDVRAFDFTINPDGTLVPPDTSQGKEKWSAADTLNARKLTTNPRKILFNGGNNTLADFTYANLTTANLASAFDNRCGVPPTTRLATELLSQCSQLTTAQQSQVTGDNLVKYLSGDGTLAQSGSTIFRTRKSLLGDIVNASPVHVGKPPFQYADAGYSNFVTQQATRTRMLYVAANDGMLHAFNADASGAELWAFIPSTVIPDLWILADSNYNYNHRYFVDASPVLADVYDGSSWHTILVGGLGAGGRAYYALDVTTPASPKLLWEFSVKDDANLGLTLGKPIVTKNAAGTWVVALTSGANNINPGNGIGQLFVLNAMTGTRVITPSISTCVSGACKGDTTTPNNLLEINAWTVSPADNTAKRYYGGDMLGNMWRFDADNLVPPPGIEATLLGTAVSADGKVQSITTRPVLNEIKANGQPVAVVSFGTGRLFGLSDYSDMTIQSIYTIRDKLADSSSLGLLRTSPAGASAAGLVQQTMKGDRSVTSTTVNWSDSAVNGWFVDLLPAGASATGERVIVNGVSFSNILGIATMLPTTDSNPCKPSGTSYLYQFGLETGAASQAEAFSDVITGLSVIVQDGSGEKAVLATTSKGEVKTSAKDKTLPPTPGNIKRTSWRELVD